MATTFLDKTGLTYLWGKIKAWGNATFAAITHSHTSNAVNAMTGYSKPNSGSAIAVSDSLNSAIGKLEVKIDSIDDSNIVHITGEETISGKKTFSDNIYVSKDSPIAIFKNTSLNRNDAPSSNSYRKPIQIQDSSNNMFWCIEHIYLLNKTNGINFIAYPVDNTASPMLALLSCYNSESNKFDRRVITNCGIWQQIYDATKGTAPSSYKSCSIFMGTNQLGTWSEHTLGEITTGLYPNGNTKVELRAFKNEVDSTDYSSLGVMYDTANNYKYAYAPTASSNAVDCEIITAFWIRQKSVPADLYINPSTGSDSNNGWTSSSAFKTIYACEQAISNAIFKPSYITVHLAAGTYTHGLNGVYGTTVIYSCSDASINGAYIYGMKHIKIYGSFTLRGALFVAYDGFIEIGETGVTTTITCKNYNSYAVFRAQGGVIRVQYGSTKVAVNFTGTCTCSNAVFVAEAPSTIDCGYSGGGYYKIVFSGTLSSGKKYTVGAGCYLLNVGADSNIPGTAGTVDSKGLVKA